MPERQSVRSNGQSTGAKRSFKATLALLGYLGAPRRLCAPNVDPQPSSIRAGPTCNHCQSFLWRVYSGSSALPMQLAACGCIARHHGFVDIIELRPYVFRRSSRGLARRLTQKINIRCSASGEHGLQLLESAQLGEAFLHKTTKILSGRRIIERSGNLDVLLCKGGRDWG